MCLMKGKLRKLISQRLNSLGPFNRVIVHVIILNVYFGSMASCQSLFPLSASRPGSFRQAFSATDNCSAYNKVNLLSTLPLACAVHTPRRHDFQRPWMDLPSKPYDKMQQRFACQPPDRVPFLSFWNTSICPIRLLRNPTASH